MLGSPMHPREYEMKSAWIAIAAAIAATSSPLLAESTIYKHVDESGRVTYSNKPMKGATVMEMEPAVTIPARAAGITTSWVTFHRGAPNASAASR